MIEVRMEKKLSQESLRTIILKESSVIWLKKNKEILLNGEPFDIKTIIRKGNNIIVSGLFDHEEKRLKKELEVYHHSENNTTTKNNSLLLLFFTTIYRASEPIGISTPFFINKKKAWKYHHDNICSHIAEIKSPPPRIS